MLILTLTNFVLMYIQFIIYNVCVCLYFIFDNVINDIIKRPVTVVGCRNIRQLTTHHIYFEVLTRVVL